MPGFSALAADTAATTIEVCGDPAVFVPESGPEVTTFAVLREQSHVVGDFGRMPDPRPSVDLLRAHVGRPRAGTLRMLGRVFKLDGLMPADDGEPGSFGDDGYVVQYYLREVPA